jgi:hypothetical protein
MVLSFIISLISIYNINNTNIWQNTRSNIQQSIEEKFKQEMEETLITQGTTTHKKGEQEQQGQVKTTRDAK